MAWDKSCILAACSAYASYSRGSSLYREGNPSIFSDERISFFQYGFRGAVKDGVETFYAKIFTDRDQFIANSCSCGHGRAGQGLCAHQVAIALKWLELHEGLSDNEIMSTDAGFSDMIEGYSKMLDEQYREDDDGALLHLHPQLLVSGSTVHASFKIGDSKMYVLKNVEDLYDAYKDHTTLSYGKSLSVVPERSNFTGYDGVLFDIIIRGASDYLKNINYRFSYQGHRSIKLTPSEIDDIILPKIGDYIEVNYGGRSTDCHVLEKNPRLSFGFDDKKKNGVTFVINDTNWTIIAGEEHIYIVKGDKLYVCDEEFSKDCRIFLETMNSLKDTGKTRIDVYRDDVRAFFLNVIPMIEKHLDISTEGVSIEQYIPKALKAQFYLDMPVSRLLSLEMFFNYGEERFNPLAVSHTEANRDVHKEKAIGNLVGRYFKLKDENNRLLIDNDEQIFAFLKNGMDELKRLGEVYVTDALDKVKVLKTPKVSVGVNVKSDLLNLKVTGDGVDGEDLRGILDDYKLKRRFHRLKDGSFVELDAEDESLEKVSDIVTGLRIRDKSLSDVNLPKNRAFYLSNTLDLDDENVEADDKYRELVEAFEDENLPEYEIPEGLNATLRDYQAEGYRWLRRLSEHGFGGILADDMGLGKTIQVITLLLSRRSDENTSLICCPASLVYNWRCEFEKFAPSLKTVCVLGDAQVRENIIRDYKDYDCLITSYDVLRRDVDAYKGKHFAFQIVDEAQFIKNQNTQKAQSVKEIEADAKFALTGTPIENRLSELWSIFDYLMSGYLFSYQMFKANLEQPIVKENDEEALAKLKKLISPFILRRLKKDVLTSLPDKIEEVIYSQMEGEQKKLYDASVSELLEGLSASSDDDVKKNKIQILAKLTRLRQLCCDPALVYENYTGGSGKLDTCMELIGQAIDGGHKILLFSQFTSMLDEIALKLQEANISYYILTGETPLQKRAEMVELFNSDETKLFLISLKAGGTGLNLTAADIVIHYDPWWNVAAQNQATDRSHRIGQESNVNVYKLIARDTIEDRILTLQQNKQKLSDDILGAEFSQADFDKNELLDILKNR
ncbi:MAG: DEAD/DEAH box helicase [Lachnospiraceae bacterium]|nr:DEAD/DEAH box helicase [Lachnospiraceae bacterium]